MMTPIERVKYTRVLHDDLLKDVEGIERKRIELSKGQRAGIFVSLAIMLTNIIMFFLSRGVFR
jgi:hypothetical protein